MSEESAVPPAFWRSAIQVHARRAAELYSAEQLQRVAQLAGFSIAADGKNTASSRKDVDRYLAAVKVVLGPLAVASARMAIMNRVRELSAGR